ncbi:ribonucleosidetriphosphate reductase, adenosylcobalamin-dependent, putative [Acanthamoeba castellanii str. Neff]|uniref:ribonucleoside-triphosphate reductase (thioredoxin) n=1 Tax=Acanthamoeba castellanii (strain ATCC 30010 / Neff) TaxID=1257118 RepID=L8HFM0_ACACF|nr:ribonucleosidetriphosphate reductase, adenosylcobalamin-dependent, putative [Acanthamoeba castellanii str. Neff]ELR24324.1 ribonucleosidetriphosphate reductase, adenosylcobalamin-dependent, putative [Acanthamoeba castellanii str. Neff]
MDIHTFDQRASAPFRLSSKFVSKFKDKQPPFGFNGLGEFVYRRTYSRLKKDGSKEEWHETVERVVNGTYNMQKKWIETHQLGWNPWKAQKSRGLWAMGSNITEERGLYAALNNCAFVSTEAMREDASKPFVFLMDASMLGVGVGFDTKGAGSMVVKGSRRDRTPELVKIPDSREGWVESVRLLLDSYFHGNPCPEFDYSLIRKAGEPIKGFGGVSSGPESLQQLHHTLREVLDKQVGEPISVTTIVDIMNLIGRCVVSGNVRRSAEIAFGDPHLEEYLDLKNYGVNPQRAAYGWTSNNSVLAHIGMDYDDICKRIAINGEPGIAWLDNMQAFSRMNGVVDNRDSRARGGNPCLEQTLEPYELCCLVETFPGKHESLEDFKRTLKFAYLYGKTVTLGKTHWPETNRVMLRNRRIGCSMSGIAQFISDRGLENLRVWCEEGYNTIRHYDDLYSDWLAIPKSIKVTSIKPSGTVSLLAGATPGMHYPISSQYIRRVRLSSNSDLLPALKEAGLKVEPAVGSESNTAVVEFPVSVGKGIRKANELSMWEQLALASFLQRHWADNQVSCTVTFDPETEASQLKHALDYYQYQLKGISFLPRSTGVYPQMPYEEIDEATYQEMLAHFKQPDFRRSEAPQEAYPEKFCDTDVCTIDEAATPAAAVGAKTDSQ